MARKVIFSIWEVASAKWAVKKKFVGQWRITELQGFDFDYVDLCGPAKVKISTRGTGRMNFGAIEVELDSKTDDRDGRVLRFSFAVGPIPRSLLRLGRRNGMWCGLHGARSSLQRSCQMPRGLPRGSLLEGLDEGDPICGHGYCLIEGNEMVGRMFRHFGDEFGFKAKRMGKGGSKIEEA